MSQSDVMDFLEQERELNNNWFSCTDIKKKLKEQGKGGINNIYNDLFKLASFNIIEWKGQGLWDHKKVFRAKKDDTKKKGKG